MVHHRKNLLALRGVVYRRSVNLERVRHARELSGITQSQAAELLGLDRVRLRDIECGRMPLGPGCLEELADLYSVRIAWMQGQTSSRQQIMARSGTTAADLVELEPAHCGQYLADLDAIA